MGIDRKNRSISLSIKAKDMADEAEAMQDYAQSDAKTSLGDILKEHISGEE